MCKLFLGRYSCKTDGSETTTGIETEDTDISSIQVFPVPASQELNVWFAANGNENTSIRLFDLQGKLQAVDVAFEATGKAKLNTANLRKGVYLMVLNSGSTTTKRSVVID